jgi:AcrR family transcriptional regulator
MEKPTIKRKEREKEARRQAILEAAARVFSRKTFYEATLDEIASEAELAKGTLYNYYKDKQDIFLSLIDRGVADYQEVLNDVITSGKSLKEVLTQCFETSLKLVRTHRYMYRLMITAGAHLSDNVRVGVLEVWLNQSRLASEKLAEAFSDFPETSGMSADDRLTGARLTFSAIHDLHHRAMLEEDSGSMQEEIDNYVRLLIRALTLEQTT